MLVYVGYAHPEAINDYSSMIYLATYKEMEIFTN